MQDVSAHLRFRPSPSWLHSFLQSSPPKASNRIQPTLVYTMRHAIFHPPFIRIPSAFQRHTHYLDSSMGGSSLHGAKTEDRWFWSEQLMHSTSMDNSRKCQVGVEHSSTCVLGPSSTEFVRAVLFHAGPRPKLRTRMWLQVAADVNGSSFGPHLPMLQLSRLFLCQCLKQVWRRVRPDRRRWTSVKQKICNRELDPNIHHPSNIHRLCPWILKQVILSICVVIQTCYSSVSIPYWHDGSDGLRLYEITSVSHMPMTMLMSR